MLFRDVMITFEHSMQPFAEFTEVVEHDRGVVRVLNHIPRQLRALFLAIHAKKQTFQKDSCTAVGDHSPLHTIFFANVTK